MSAQIGALSEESPKPKGRLHYEGASVLSVPLQQSATFDEVLLNGLQALQVYGQWLLLSALISWLLEWRRTEEQNMRHIEDVLYGIHHIKALICWENTQHTL